MLPDENSVLQELQLFIKSKKSFAARQKIFKP